MAVPFENIQREFGVRQLEKFDESQTILMTLYVCVLAICCVTPIFYFVRLQMAYRHHHHLRRLETAGILAAIHESQQNREESRAARRKYLEERKARISQLFRSVRLVCTFNDDV